MKTRTALILVEYLRGKARLRADKAIAGDGDSPTPPAVVLGYVAEYIDLPDIAE